MQLYYLTDPQAYACTNIDSILDVATRQADSHSTASSPVPSRFFSLSMKHVAATKRQKIKEIYSNDPRPDKNI